jgi:phage shock protein A
MKQTEDPRRALLSEIEQVEKQLEQVKSKSASLEQQKKSAEKGYQTSCKNYDATVKRISARRDAAHEKMTQVSNNLRIVQQEETTTAQPIQRRLEFLKLELVKVTGVQSATNSTGYKGKLYDKIGLEYNTSDGDYVNLEGNRCHSNGNRF